MPTVASAKLHDLTQRRRNGMWHSKPDVGASLRKLGSVLRSARLARGIGLLAGGTALGQGLIVAASPLLTRLYAPEDMGVWSIYISMLSIAVVGSMLRYEVAIPLPQDDSTAANVLALALTVLLGTSLLAAAAVWLLGKRLTLLVGAPGLWPHLWLLPLGLIALGIAEALNLWALRAGAFARAASTRLSQSIGMVLAQLGFGVLGAGPLGLLVADAIGRMSSAATLMALMWSSSKTVLGRVSPRRMREAAVRYRRFPQLATAAALLCAVGTHVPMLFMAALYGSTVMGLLALAQRVLVVPLNLIASSAAQVYLSESAKAAHAEPARLPRLFSRLLGAMLCVSLPYVVILALAAPVVFPVVFGGAWAEAGVYVRILAAMVLMQNLATPVSGTLDVLERQDLHLLSEIVRGCLMTGVVTLATALRLPPRVGIVLFSAAGVVTYAFLMLASVHVIRRRRGDEPQGPAGAGATNSHV